MYLLALLVPPLAILLAGRPFQAVFNALLWLAGLAWALRYWRRVGAGSRALAFPATVALGAMLFPLNTHLAFYSAWWGLLFAWLLGMWCAALGALPDGEAADGA